VPTPRSRSSSSLAEAELRLPRAPGVIRQFWARHPLFADILIALFCLLISLVPAAPFQPAELHGGEEAVIGPQWTVAIPLAVVAAACVLLVWRRTQPTLAFAVGLLGSVSFLVFAPPNGSPLILVTTYALAVYRSSRAAWTGLAVAVGTLSLLALALLTSGTITFENASNAVIGEVVLGLIGSLIGVNVGNRRRYLEAVIERSRQLLVERDQQSRLAAAAERARIAREMHDIVSHSLTVVVALSEGAAATPDHERARSAMDAAAATARGALTEMRSMLGVLRDSGPDAPLTPMAPAAPEVTVAAAQRAGFPATLTVTGAPVVSDAVRFAIGRIVQEGVTNAMRHAPGATTVLVRIDYTDAEVHVTIRNDGVSQPVEAGGFGIRGLMERAAHVGGSVTSEPGRDGLWELRAVLPSGTVTADAPARSSASEEWRA
jgi:signal transduction histidine kinase